MPYIHIHTNLNESVLKDGVEDRIAKVVADTLGKPLEKMNVIIVTGIRLQRFGSKEPAVTVTISSVGSFDAQRNPAYGPAIKQVFKEEFGVENDRCGIVFHELDINFVA